MIVFIHEYFVHQFGIIWLQDKNMLVVWSFVEEFDVLIFDALKR